MSSRKTKKPSVFDRLGPPEEEPRGKHYKKKSKDKEANADSRRGTSSSHGSRHAPHQYNHTPDGSATTTEHSSDGKRSKPHNDAKTKSVEGKEGKASHGGGGKERKRSHSHLDETGVMPSAKKQKEVNDAAPAPERVPGLKESDRSVSRQKRMRMQAKEEKQPPKGRTTDSGSRESKQDGVPDTVPKAKRPRLDTDISSASDPPSVDAPQVANVETRLREGSLSSTGGGPVQRKASTSAPEVNRFAELDHAIASTQPEPAVVKKRMEGLLGPSSGNFLNTCSPTRVYADVGCSERFSGELYSTIVNALGEKLEVDAFTLGSPGGTGMGFAKALQEKQRGRLSVHEAKLGAFTAVDDRKWRQKMVANSSKTSSDSKSTMGPKFNQDGYLKAVALMKLSQSKVTSTSTRILDASPSVKLAKSK